jgi:hypothetical protein
LSLPVFGFSQSSKDIEKEAIKFQNVGDFSQESTLWVKLYTEKEKNDYAFEAAENYYRLKDYRQAAQFYLKVKNVIIQN